MRTNMNQADSFYSPGLQSREEAVISAHFMHADNMNTDFNLYTQEEFNNKKIEITQDDFLNTIVPAVQNSVQSVIEKRTPQIAQNTRRHHDDYGIHDANKVTAVEIITEALLDYWFRKGPLENSNKLFIRDKIAKHIANDEKIQLVVPLLPNKVDTPLKTRGAIPCMAEISLLSRLAEVTGVINKVLSEYMPESNSRAEFLILADGHRFQDALNVGEEKVQAYQDSIQWWIQALGYDESIKFTDYEQVVSLHLGAEGNAQRHELMADAYALYEDTMSPLLDSQDMLKSLQDAVDNDPFPDEANVEGRFVPLFKSILYTYEDDLLPKYCQKWNVPYQDLYREITSRMYDPFTELSDSKMQHLRETILGIGADNSDDVKEFFRRNLIEHSWEATIKYLAAVKGDRDLFEDPVSQIFPDHIRYTIHAKKGQIGLCTTGSKKGDLVQAWHGVSFLRPTKKNMIKFDNVSCLSVEGHGALPVTIAFNDATEGTPLSRLSQADQPMFYVDKKLDVTTAEQVCDVVEKSMTRFVFR